jgi:uncharacterized protein (DUF2141 family)
MTVCGGAWRRALVLAALALPAPALAAQLDIELTGIENDYGMVRVAVCTPATFTTKHCPFNGAAPAKGGSVVVSVPDIPPGRYAVQAYHDEDGNGRLRKGLFGLPAEAIGFSRDARVRLGAPSFNEAAIDVAEPVTATRLRLRHLGP